MAVIGRHLVSRRLLALRESMLQQISERFMAGSREYEAALGRKMEMENVGLKDIVASYVSMVSSGR
jgi:hypothetical protein